MNLLFVKMLNNANHTDAERNQTMTISTPKTILHDRGTTNMARIISIANQKGGVGKTTTALSLAQTFAEAGRKSLLVDLDPQCNASDTLKALTDRMETMYDVMKGRCTALAAVQHVGENLDCIQSNLQLASADMEFSMQGREHIIRKALSSLSPMYDYIVIDTLPALGILTINALTAANEVVVPFGADRYSMQGMFQLRDTIKAVQEYSNPNLRIAGILLTMDRPKTILSRDTKSELEDVARLMGAKVFSTSIRYAEIAKQGVAEQENIMTYAPQSTVAQDYRTFAHDLMGARESKGRER